MKKRNYFLVVALILFVGVGVFQMKHEFAAPENKAMRFAREYTREQALRVKQAKSECKQAKRWLNSERRSLRDKYLDAEKITPRDMRYLRSAREDVGVKCR